MKISNTSERLKVIMEERQIKQIDILHLVAPYCEQHGIKMNRSDISQYVSGKVEPSQDKLTVLSLALGVSEPWLMGYDLTRDGKDKGTSDFSLPAGIVPISELHFQRVPVIGSVAAGEPIYAPEELGVYAESPVDADAAITIQGDSMSPTYKDGDLVYIKCTPDVPDGTVAVVFLDDEATLKRVYKQPGGLMLISENTAHPPIMASFDDYTSVRVFGVPVGYTRIYRPKGKKKH